ncbi:MAG: KGK domain-containing protein [Microcystaceae cyanobacterium]
MSDQHKFSLNFNDDDVIQFDENGLTRFSKLRRAIWENGKAEIMNKLHEILNKLCSKSQLNIPASYCLTDQNGGVIIGRDGIAEQFENSWSKDGVHCEVLKLGSQQWQKGKIRIKFEIEFIPDEPEISEPESPLDDIRREINQS